MERALARAAQLDDALKKTGKVVGPLHGLPISLKDQICIKGLETTMGYVSWIGKYAEKNAVLVDILEECGAVPFVRTNVPQTLMVRLNCPRFWSYDEFKYSLLISGLKLSTTFLAGRPIPTTVHSLAGVPPGEKVL